MYLNLSNIHATLYTNCGKCYKISKQSNVDHLLKVLESLMMLNALLIYSNCYEQ